MKRDAINFALNLGQELIIDNFASGGGRRPTPSAPASGKGGDGG